MILNFIWKYIDLCENKEYRDMNQKNEQIENQNNKISEENTQMQEKEHIRNSLKFTFIWILVFMILSIGFIIK